MCTFVKVPKIWTCLIRIKKVSWTLFPIIEEGKWSKTDFFSCIPVRAPRFDWREPLNEAFGQCCMQFLSPVFFPASCSERKRCRIASKINFFFGRKPDYSSSDFGWGCFHWYFFSIQKTLIMAVNLPSVMYVDLFPIYKLRRNVFFSCRV